MKLNLTFPSGRRLQVQYAAPDRNYPLGVYWVFTFCACGHNVTPEYDGLPLERTPEEFLALVAEELARPRH